ncbi:MAG: hypothetical protein KDD51_12805 [Bdellovibrionales bacterium]|nr:hypothetical protein [Bdellovibrionales bacterium]
MDRKKYILAAFLALLVATTVGMGLYYKHYFVVFVFAVWLCVEFLVWRSPVFVTRLVPDKKSGEFARLVALFGDRADASDRQILEHVTERLLPMDVPAVERKALESLRALVELRVLAFGEVGEGRLRLRQAFIYLNVGNVESVPAKLSYEFAQIAESASLVSGLYWNLYECAGGKFAPLTSIARGLHKELFGSEFSENSRAEYEHLVDSMQRDGGIAYLILNLLASGQLRWARETAQNLLRENTSVDEEVRSSLYWLAEMQSFSAETPALTDYDSCIRYLYHVCFSNPDRAGFLEIDSQFFSQFEMINELAREGFLFKEMLIEKMLGLWAEHNHLFDRIFQAVLQLMAGQTSKIYDTLDYWKRFWSREKEGFGREYLYVVEGNLCFVNGHWGDAVLYYEKALAIDPALRSALLNLPFCYARLKDDLKHQQACEKVARMAELHPNALYAAGNSYLMIGKEAEADTYYKALEKYDGWEYKADHYKSTFCYEHGLYEQALLFAKRAHSKNPNDVVMRYHLSLCYNAVGEKDKALEMVKKVGTAPHWLNYYRFTLERDAGHHGEASETLLNLPSEYFDDPEELDEAVSFARLRRDLVLLRHLKKD